MCKDYRINVSQLVVHTRLYYLEGLLRKGSTCNRLAYTIHQPSDKISTDSPPDQKIRSEMSMGKADGMVDIMIQPADIRGLCVSIINHHRCKDPQLFHVSESPVYIDVPVFD